MGSQRFPSVISTYQDRLTLCRPISHADGDVGESSMFPHAVLPPQSRAVSGSLLGDVPGPRHTRVQQALNHTIDFLHVPVGAHTNTIGSMWRHYKALLNSYDPVADYVHPSTNCMFLAWCRCENFDHFTPSLQPFTSPPSRCSRNVIHFRPTTNNTSRHPQIVCGTDHLV